MPMFKRGCVILLLLSAAACGASNVLDPEAGRCVPQNPGTVVVRVADQAGAPIPNVNAAVGEIPNCVGSFFSVGIPTGSNGLATFPMIPAGSRPVSITLPAGFAAGADGLVRQVAVVNAASVTVEFRLIRQ
jgi:hypothetical protein